MVSNPVSHCAYCGRELPADSACARCARSKVFRLIHRELLLLLFLSLVAAAVYFATRAYAGLVAHTKAETAAAWYRQGERELHANHPDEAVAAYRRASVNDHTRQRYPESLARALEVAGRESEARQVLLQLRESAPENPQINTELARLAAHEHEIPEALRYYHNAVYGIWTGDSIDQRQREIRGELINFLIAQHAHDQALAEILALAYHLPDTVPAHLELGDMFTRAGDPLRARSEFTLVLRHEPRNQTALEGAGTAAFQLRNYSQTQQLLGQLKHRTAAQQETLETATLAVNNDPAEPRLPYGERPRRVIFDFDHSGVTLNNCLAQRAGQNTDALTALSGKFSGMRPLLTAPKISRSPGLVFTALELIYQAETETAKSCGALPPLDRALLLITQKDRGEP